MKTVEDIFGAFDGPLNLSTAIGISIQAASNMRRRKVIHPRHWEALILAAAAHDPPIAGITYQALTQMHAKPAAAPAMATAAGDAGSAA